MSKDVVSNEQGLFTRSPFAEELHEPYSFFLWQLYAVPTLTSREIDSRAKFKLLIADFKDCDFLFASTMRPNAPTATSATTANIPKATIISTSVKPFLSDNLILCNF